MYIYELFLHTYVYIYMFIHIYLCIYINMNIHIYVCIYISSASWIFDAGEATQIQVTLHRLLITHLVLNPVEPSHLLNPNHLQGYLTYKQTHPPRTLP